MRSSHVVSYPLIMPLLKSDFFGFNQFGQPIYYVPNEFGHRLTTPEGHLYLQDLKGGLFILLPMQPVLIPPPVTTINFNLNITNIPKPVVPPQLPTAASAVKATLQSINIKKNSHRKRRAKKPHPSQAVEILNILTNKKTLAQPPKENPILNSEIPQNLTQFGLKPNPALQALIQPTPKLVPDNTDPKNAIESAPKFPKFFEPISKTRTVSGLSLHPYNLFSKNNSHIPKNPGSVFAFDIVTESKILKL